MNNTETLIDAALEILNTENSIDKAKLSDATAKRWLQGQIPLPFPQNADLSVPNRPARPNNLRLVSPSLMPKLGRGGSLQSRQAMLHSLVHTESWAIDLSWDIIARFGRKELMPRDFFNDFVKVAQDEARHFLLLVGRLEEIGSYYGAFSAHDALWDSAMRTSNDLAARLAVEHCVHEARGLDVLPITISRFRNGGDECTANLLETVVYPEEITHCAAGVKWFTYLLQRRISGHQNAIMSSVCLSPQKGATEEHSEQQKFDNRSDGFVGAIEQPMNNSVESGNQNVVIKAFHDTVRRYFRGPLKPPFNVEARKAAGFASDWCFIG